MKNSLERIRAVLNGGQPDRAPMFDLLRNTAAIEHFTGEKLTVENGAELVYKAYEPAIDGTRPLVKSPNAERTELLPDGRRQEIYRWTIWTEHRHFADSADYEAEKRAWLAGFDPAWTAELGNAQKAELA